ncbi:anti-sigma factor family protein [Chloroflexus sp.]|uniref:anti-sigma factor family protein n=1 Tax=Chloroflexus sp. TaxID=1904827 RepID=UPI00260C859D|nr:zf-HC2 domain-containing protein [uncultured Chloroflexus sp.]
MESHAHHHCLDLIDRLNEYLDGELNADSCAELEAHLRACPECQELLLSLQQTVDLLHHLDDEPLPLPPALEDRLARQLQQRLATKSH